MKIRVWVSALVVWMMVAAFATSIQAQEQAWLQVEAQPTLAKAEERARAYASLFPDTRGFKLRSGWFAVVLGPQTPEQAAGRLTDLKRQGMIPGDSYITDGADHRAAFWPAGATDATTGATTGGATIGATDGLDALVDEMATAGQAGDAARAAQAPAAEATTAEAPAAEDVPADETPAEARRSEAAMSDDARKTLQEALSWYGFYNGGIDGSFGAGTRNSMAAWQEANGFEPTGILTTRQRDGLMGKVAEDKARFGFESVTEAESGIEITLPLALVGFDRYEPPFVHFSEKNGSGMQIILISQPGDSAALGGLYDVLQTLAVVPAEGERSKGDKSFTINARSDTVQSYAFAEAGEGVVKGYLVVWKPADAARMERILPVLKASFRSVGDKALDPGLVPLDAATKAGLLAGLEVKQPKLSRSGFFVDDQGAVLTTSEAVASCGRITLEGSIDATVAQSDAASGLSLLRPKTALAPRAVAGFQQAAPRVGSGVSVAGYSYEGKLPAPVLTIGTLADLAGLNGETGLRRLDISALPGDAGGPVVDATGSVIGMLLPRASEADRKLPEGVEFAASADLITGLMTQAGITPRIASQTTPATPDALNAQALGMTVLVSCWD